jgi:hypothetical protein
MPVKSPNHTILIREVDGEFVVPPKHFPLMYVGQTARYVTNTKDGRVKIKFTTPSPYRTDNRKNTVVYGDKVLKVVRESTGRGLLHDAFHFLCFIKEPGQAVKGWSKKGDQMAGGESTVKKPAGGPG